MKAQPLFEHHDTLETLNRNLPASEKLRAIHRALRHRLPQIDRIAIALYDAKTDVLRTFINSGDANPLPHYESRLQDAPSLAEILRCGRPRVVNNLTIFERGEHKHTRNIAEQGYAASYTLPMYLNGVFFGFLFFNSYQRDLFQPDVLSELDLFGHLAAQILINELTAVRTLASAVQATRDITYYRDTETAGHIDRVAHYALLIARTIAGKYGLTDETIEEIFMFAPLHDVGKIGVPDRLLNKPGQFTDAEREAMKQHVLKGREIIDAMVRDFGLDGVHNIDILRNIAEYHHEAVNGTGYLRGLKDQDIPLEARIVAVADVFDALTSRRCYKDAWTNADAFAALERLAGTTLDHDCVAALIQNAEAVTEIQQRFGQDKPPESNMVASS
jgi:HD-GYP domain-containing protein (c-di-GMP phosphodiesterase class II)